MMTVLHIEINIGKCQLTDILRILLAIHIFANRTEPVDENSWNFKNKLDPSGQHLQINRSYSISGG
jgi:hypothetical protein